MGEFNYLVMVKCFFMLWRQSILNCSFYERKGKSKKKKKARRRNTEWASNQTPVAQQLPCSLPYVSLGFESWYLQYDITRLLTMGLGCGVWSMVQSTVQSQSQSPNPDRGFLLKGKKNEWTSETLLPFFCKSRTEATQLTGSLLLKKL